MAGRPSLAGAAPIERDWLVPFACHVLPERERVRVVPVGELDLVTAPTLEQTVEELRAAGVDHVVLDLSRLDFLAVAGLRSILALDAAGRSDTLTFELIAGPPSVQRLFALTGTLDRLPFRTPTQTPGGAPLGR